MKKLLVAVAVLMGVSTMSFANSNDSIPPQDKNELVAQVVQDTYKEVKAEELNAKVQEALKGYEATYTVKKLEYNESKKQTQVTLEDKSTKAEKVVLIDDEGKEVK